MFTGRDNCDALFLLLSLHDFSLCYQNIYIRSYSSIIECYVSNFSQFICLFLHLTENTQLLFSACQQLLQPQFEPQRENIVSLIKTNTKVRGASCTMLFLSDYNPNQNMLTHFITQWRQPRFTKHAETLNQPQFVISDKSLE